MNMKDPSNWVPREIYAGYCGENSDKLLAVYDKAVAEATIPVAS